MSVSTLWVPSTATAMKVMHWRMIIVNVEVKKDHYTMHACTIT